MATTLYHVTKNGPKQCRFGGSRLCRAKIFRFRSEHYLSLFEASRVYDNLLDFRTGGYDISHWPNVSDNVAQTGVVEDGVVIHQRHGRRHREDGPAVVHPNGVKRWYRHGRPHRDNGPANIIPATCTDLIVSPHELHEYPSQLNPGPGLTAREAMLWDRLALFDRPDESHVVNVTQSEQWFNQGRLHRKGGPALSRVDGLMAWFIRGELHREEGPAIIRPDGSEYWYLKGKQHREGGPAVTLSDGTREWRVLGKLHREDGPAKIGPEGHQEWHQNGVLHRSNGPAVVRTDGTQEWWTLGVESYRDAAA